VTVETFTAATDHRDPTSAAQRVRNYVRAFAQLGREGRAVAAVDTLDHVGLDVRDLDALVDAVDHGAGRVPVNRALAAARAEVAALTAENALLRGELVKVRGHRAELAERCYRKDLELDELRPRPHPEGSWHD
jgi:hypothetical protein